MTLDNARSWIIKASLAISGLHIAFLVIAPAAGYPLTYPEALRLIEIVIPVFFAYLGSATHFLFKPAANRAPVESPTLLALMVRGPLLVFGGVSAIALVAFGISNRPPTARGNGMELDTLAAFISAGLGLLAVSTNVIVQYLFATSEKESVTAPRTPTGDGAGGVGPSASEPPPANASLPPSNIKAQ